MRSPVFAGAVAHLARATPLLVVLVLCLLPCLTSATAQEAAPDASTPASAAGADEPAPEALADPEPPPPPASLANARATMRTFLESFDPAKAPSDRNPLDQAASCLDLSAIDEALRRGQGRELAVQLKEALDKTVLIEFDRLPASPDAQPWRLPVADTGEVVLAPSADGAWRFTAATVESIPELLQALRGLEKVEGVTETGPLTPAMWIRSLVPPALLDVTFLLENWQWLGILLLAIVGVLVDRLVVAGAQGGIQRYLERRTEALDTDQLRASLRPIGLFAAAGIWRLFIHWLGLPTQVLRVLVVAIEFVGIVAFVWAMYRLVDVVAAVLELRARRSANKFDDLLVPLFRKSAKVFVAALGIVFIADNLDIEITSLIAGLGIGGLALALASQDLVKNLFGSLMVIVDRPFSVGDWVVIDGVEGTVMELGFRSTRIKTFYDSTITLPNSNLISAAVDNYGARTYRRWKTYLGLVYSTPPEKVEAFCEGVRELVRLHPEMRKDYFHVYLNQFSASSIDVLLYVFFDTPDWGAELRARQRLALDILRLAHELGVEFAFPTQTLHLHRAEAAAEPPPSAGYGERVEAGHGEARRRAAALVESFSSTPESLPGEGS